MLAKVDLRALLARKLTMWVVMTVDAGSDSAAG